MPSSIKDDEPIVLPASEFCKSHCLKSKECPIFTSIQHFKKGYNFVKNSLVPDPGDEAVDDPGEELVNIEEPSEDDLDALPDVKFVDADLMTPIVDLVGELQKGQEQCASVRMNTDEVQDALRATIAEREEQEAAERRERDLQDLLSKHPQLQKLVGLTNTLEAFLNQQQRGNMHASAAQPLAPQPHVVSAPIAMPEQERQLVPAPAAPVGIVPTPALRSNGVHAQEESQQVVLVDDGYSKRLAKHGMLIAEAQEVYRKALGSGLKGPEAHAYVYEQLKGKGLSVQLLADAVMPSTKPGDSLARKNAVYKPMQEYLNKDAGGDA